MGDDQDRADVERVLAGDVDAFEGIVRRWQGPLLNLAYRFCRDRGRAEEMTQEAFLKIYRALARWRADATFSTWAFAVAANSYRSEVRRRPPRLLALDAAGETADPSSVETDLNLREESGVVRSAVLTLPPRYRDAVVLYYFHGQDLQQTSRSLGLRGGTVKARLFRARRLLERKLARRLGVTASPEERS